MKAKLHDELLYDRLNNVSIVLHPHHVLTLEAVALVQGRPVEDLLHDFLVSWCYW